MNRRNHRHAVKSSVDHCFFGPVAQPQNEAAHGNIGRTDVCACGAERKVNINGRHVERGPWIEVLP